ncbi:MAG: hypothetical protein JWN48_4328 [Myxococcaceae bacterium]|nr:hypothetical protein [Myxococcaceae bacterium]
MLDRGVPSSAVRSRESPDAGVSGSTAEESQRAEQKLEASLTSGLKRPHAFDGEPVLRKRPDGGYQYYGVGFAAVIEPNGMVRMSNAVLRSELHMDPTVLPDGKTGGLNFFRLDLGLLRSAQAKRGNDPDRTERRWFLERTRALREQMFERHVRATGPGATGSVPDP